MKALLKYIWLIGLLLCFSCSDEDSLSNIEIQDLNTFAFPQGTNSWDKEIEQIAEDWGMYIIYKNVDSTRLNQVWTMPDFRGPVYVCDEPSDEQIQKYLEIVKDGLLSTLDKNKESDRKQLPIYLYLVNNFRDNNPVSSTYGKTVQVKIDGFNYWSLSFTDEEWEQEMTPEMTHKITCTFSYPRIEAALLSGELAIPDEFSRISDYSARIGKRYMPFDQFKAENPYYFMGVPEEMHQMIYESMVLENERDNDNAYLHRGFLPQITKDFVAVSSNYGCPTWMPWIKIFGSDVNYDYLETERERLSEDFLNYIRYAMTYTESYIKTAYPLKDVSNECELKGNQMINTKYDVVVNCIQSSLGIDLTKYAEILNEKN